jgi:hypothetical protein
MPTTGHRFEDALIDLFLNVYDSGSWAPALTTRVSPERTMDGAVEMIATRTADGVTLAIEHTLIEPFVGEKTDFHSHFKALAEQLRADPSLIFPRHVLYVNAPVNVLPSRSNWQGIINDVRDWLRSNARSFDAEWQQIDCPSSLHPEGKVTLQVRLQPLDDDKRQFPPIVQRYGEMKIADSVTKALENKLPKLARATAMKRLLMLEREQGWIAYETIYAEIDTLRPRFPELSRIDEIWIADTASFGTTKEYVDFRRHQGEKLLESFTFYRGRLESMSRNGMPLPP